MNKYFALMTSKRCNLPRTRSQAPAYILVTPIQIVVHLIACNPGARFSKVPKLFGRISGDIIVFVSSKRRRFEARNFAVILIFIPFTIYEKTSFTKYAGRSFTNGFSGLSRNGPLARVARSMVSALTSVTSHRNI